MCGIFGIVSLTGKTADPALVRRATDAIAHRGPDDSGIFTDGCVGLGHRRLSIIDLRSVAAQPMTTPDGRYTLVFNGEIYNFKSLRAELTAKGYSFQTDGDSEALLLSYAEYGADCVQKLRGMFAFAVYDREKQTVFVARDRTGQKPLKYFHGNGVFAFASELKALHMVPECPKETSEQQLYDYLTMMYLPAPATGFDGIYKLPAAHTGLLDIASGQWTVQRYWELNYQTDTTKSIDEWTESTMSLLRESVALRTIADVPLGAFLSGGIDSATIVGLLSETADQPVRTFSIGSDDPAFNELPDARIVADHFQTDHTEIPLQADIVHMLPELVRAYDEPYADPSVIPTYVLCRETRQSVTVALSGDGGDENFLGYPRYRINRFAQRWTPFIKAFQPLINAATATALKLQPTTLTYRAHRFQQTIGLPPAQRHLQYLSFFTEAEKKQFWLTPQRPTQDWYRQITSDAVSRSPGADHRYISMDIDTYLADDLLPKVDSASMAHALEVRAPFLDHVLMQHVASMPADLKIRGSESKWLLKQMVQTLVPQHILQQKKRGFRIPLNLWFRRDLRDYVYDNCIGSQSALLQYCDKNGLEQFLDYYYRTKIDFSDHVWSLLWLQEWLKMSANNA